MQASVSRGGSSTDRLSPTPPPVPAKTRGSSKDLTPQNNRMRSGSAASYSTGTSDSGDYGVEGIRHKPSYSSLSTAASSPSNPTAPGGFFRGPMGSSRGSSSNGTLHSPGTSNPALHPHGNGNGNNTSALSPVATRMRAQDQDAMQKFMNARTRTRSGSADTGTDYQTANGSVLPNGSTAAPQSNFVSAGPSANGDDITALANLNISGSVAPRRRLRPSQSASQLNSAPSAPLLNTNVVRDPAGARLRSGTGPSDLSQIDTAPSAKPPSSLTPPSDRVLFHSPTQGGPSPRPSLSRDDSSRRDREDYTGPSTAYAQFPEPPQVREGPQPIVPAPMRKETAESVKTPTQSTSSRRLPFKLTKGSSGSIDTSHRNGAGATAGAMVGGGRGGLL
jgi:uncharacterized protein